MTDQQPERELFDDLARYVRIPVALLVPLLALLIWVVSLNTQVKANMERDKEVQEEIEQLLRYQQRDHDTLIEIHAHVTYLREEFDKEQKAQTD